MNMIIKINVWWGMKQSVIVRWDPPLKEHQNGIITGYKIRYKPKYRGRLLPGMSGSSGLTATTDGSRRLFTLTGLQRETEYQIRVSALTVNGSGPTTEWILVETFENDLDESQVPEPPSSLRGNLPPNISSFSTISIAFNYFKLELLINLIIKSKISIILNNFNHFEQFQSF